MRCYFCNDYLPSQSLQQNVQIYDNTNIYQNVARVYHHSNTQDLDTDVTISPLLSSSTQPSFL